MESLLNIMGICRISNNCYIRRVMQSPSLKRLLLNTSFISKHFVYAIPSIHYPPTHINHGTYKHVINTTKHIELHKFNQQEIMHNIDKDMVNIGHLSDIPSYITTDYEPIMKDINPAFINKNKSNYYTSNMNHQRIMVTLIASGSVALWIYNRYRQSKSGQ